MIALSILSESQGRKNIVIAGDFNGHVEENPEDYQDQQKGYDCGVRSKEGERILKFCAAMNMTVRNTLFQKRASHLVNNESGPSKTHLDYFWVRRNQQKFLKDIEALPSEQCITQDKPLVCDFGMILRFKKLRHQEKV